MTSTARKSSPSLKPKITKHKLNRRNYGRIYEFPSGQIYYLADRRIAEIFRSGEPSISDAIRKGTACWALDQETLLTMRAKKIKWVGVRVKETEDIYLTHIDNFFDRTKAKILNYENRGGALQSYLPLQFFKIRLADTKIKIR